MHRTNNRKGEDWQRRQLLQFVRWTMEKNARRYGRCTTIGLKPRMDLIYPSAKHSNRFEISMQLKNSPNEKCHVCLSGKKLPAAEDFF